MEHAIPAWAFVKDQNLQKMEKFQTQCLRQILGVKAHSSTDAVEVIAQVIPFQKIYVQRGQNVKRG